MALRLKFDRLRSLRPDVAVVQECADPDAAGKGWRPDCTSYDWIGFNPDKGLGIFTFGDLALTRHPSYSETYALYLPVTVSGWCHFSLLGLWTADPRKIPPGATNDPFRRAATLSQLPRRRAIHRNRRFQPAAPADVSAAQWPRQLSGRCAGASRSDERRLCHESCLRPAGAEADALPPAQVLARLRGRLHFHPGCRGRPPRRVRGGRSARLDHLERSRAAGRRVRSGPLGARSTIVFGQDRIHMV